jgi:hypothetical protein
MTLKSTDSDDEKYKHSTLGSVDPKIQTFLYSNLFQIEESPQNEILPLRSTKNVREVNTSPLRTT